MQISNKTYKNYVESSAKKTTSLKNCVLAFISGGAVCCIGELLYDIYCRVGIDFATARQLESVSLIFIAAVFTGLGLFDKAAKYCGAGTLVPITGFANAVVSPAIDAKHEGFILGVGAKMFTIAGPVIVYGVIASVVYGVWYWLVN